MKFKEEFSNRALIQKGLVEIERVASRPWSIMEICGGQTHAFMQHGLTHILPDTINLIHGPGCPVCVTSLELVDKAIRIAANENVIFTSYGDMLRVPGSERDLFSVRAAGGDVRVVYSPMEALQIAKANPEKQVVFFAIGFETTAPGNAVSIIKAKEQDIGNYSMLVSHVRVPPAMRAILSAPKNKVQGFLAAGHVCAIMGMHEYEPVAEQFSVPITVTGFEPLDLVLGILKTVRMLETGAAKVANAYSRAVSFKGNQSAQNIIAQVFTECDRQWRGIGEIPISGWKLNEVYRAYDAENRFDVGDIQTQESTVCISGQILQGIKKPDQCPAFGKECTPLNPLGATMVSSEGACAAYYKYGNVHG